MRAQRVSPCQDCKVLLNNGFEQRRHQLVVGYPLFLQTVYVGFCKNAAFTCHRVKPDSVISLVTQFIRWNFQLCIDLIDNGASTAGAFIVHARDFFLLSCFRVFFKNNDFRILTAKLDDRPDLRVHFLNGKRYRSHFLHEFSAQMVNHVRPAASRYKQTEFFGSAIKVFLDTLQVFYRYFRLFCLVPLVIPP